jgi:hypothetical protein
MKPSNDNGAALPTTEVPSATPDPALVLALARVIARDLQRTASAPSTPARRAA